MKKRFGTLAIHTGDEPNLKDGGTGDVVTPIHLASTFARKKVQEPTAGYEYTRVSNPSRNAFERKLAALEGARFGLAFASGLATETALILSLVKTGDHVVAFDDLYGGSRRLFTKVFEADYGVQFTFVDARDPEKVKAAIRDNTKLFWLETPTNPLMKLCDIELLSGMAKERDIITVVDNTFASPYLQNPLSLGANVVFHSTTKYINGHTDSLGGAILLNDEKMHEKLRFNQKTIGSILSAFDSFLVSRGLKTLHVRMQRHCENAMAVAEFLERHPRVRSVNYPGLPSHPQHELAKRQMRGFGGMISFVLDGELKDASKFVESLEFFLLAESLGGIESLAEIPALMTHASVPDEERRALGISDSFIRLSVGIEDINDLIADLENGFAQLD